MSGPIHWSDAITWDWSDQDMGIAEYKTDKIIGP